MNKSEYQAILQPAIDRVIEQLIDNEFQYGEGIKLAEDDLIKAAGHALSAYRGLTNPDGHTHATSTATRSLMGLLGEISEEA